MLQILLETNDKYSLAEMAQMAIEGGCGWLVLRVPDYGDDELRQICPEIVELCRESSVMLTVEDRPELAKEFGMHGVYLHIGAGVPTSVREQLGPEAVVGAEVTDGSVAVALASADIDYAGLPATMPVDEASALIGSVRNASCEIPFVAFPLGIKDVEAYINAGFSGVCMGRQIFEEADPVSVIEELLAMLAK